MAGKKGHHGGAWKVAYADFTTAMMALFLCLWLTAQDTKIKEAVERAFRNPFSAVTKESVGIIPNKETTATYKAEGEFQSISAVEIETMRRISEELARILQQEDALENTVRLELTREGLRINVFDRSQKPVFEPGTDRFTPYGEWVFSTLAWEIARYTTFKIELEGHTARADPQARETLRQWELSTERANAARRQLVHHGVAPTQVCKVSGYADTMPMPDLPPDSDANRRVTILLKLKETGESLAAAAGTSSSHAARVH
ncbi:OmpA family protein [Limisphaera ngatamarikiensis]|jgi:chemotaxis protein MotB|uniref:OmpA family protein n=1 Tax=Limisphaera ngatamarikiensis TaxID=1324935 RepID=A0A6M1RGP0_9BACT|nr:flagellar motor protein MotB [Limisphaera ngatamarikiensis]NGO38776.1 OmpA family protein [Limisphaera ngatamarikiensis]